MRMKLLAAMAAFVVFAGAAFGQTGGWTLRNGYWYYPGYTTAYTRSYVSACYVGGYYQAQAQSHLRGQSQRA